MRVVAAALVALCGASAVAAQQPGMDEIRIPSGGVPMNGLIYTAAGPGPHPVVLFLHGYPGNERNLDLAQAVRRDGYDAVYFDYRGTWGSGGTFSWHSGIDDARAALTWIRDSATVAKYHLDTRRIAVVGHSYGGWVAYMMVPNESPHVCVATLAAWNIGATVQRFDAHPDERDAQFAYSRFTVTTGGGPINANGDSLNAEMVAHAQAYDYRNLAGTIGDRALLAIAATHDSPDEDVPMLRDMVHRLRASGSHHVMFIPYDDDHPFSAHRLSLARALTQWLDGDCRRSQLAH